MQPELEKLVDRITLLLAVVLAVSFFLGGVGMHWLTDVTSPVIPKQMARESTVKAAAGTTRLLWEAPDISLLSSSCTDNEILFRMI